MINTFKTLVALLVVVALQSCNDPEKKTASGMTYSLVKEGDGQPIEDGQYLLMNMEYKDDKDSVWMTTAEQGVPIVVPKNDSVWSSSEGSIEQIFNELSKGDSVTFTISIKDFFDKTVKAEMPAEVSKEGSLTFKVGVQNVLSQEEFMTWQQEMMAKQQKKREEEAEEQLTADVAAIESFLKENNIEAERTESGIFYVMKEEGAGEQAASGDTVKVNYAGHVLNGAFFDTNDEALAKEKELFNEQRAAQGGYDPLEFVLGQGRVIKGWDEGIALLKEGGKATLYIPSPLAYGPRQRSAEIVANSILVFDVELVEVN
ncbi:FKBP-type peptidyl-prolyl cis-trans isomerase [Fulvivirga sp. 29W222]|uniref:Peptidyl-prolyl cis-trans isomerase n=1 Tax=Fulvivirga marina TaxID=2494733 RepID=A0A937KE80_9BACT|nr:FKBP-type peptidyl-prolyl cis-trans isomerase [Fulvivirga marina]MBL6446840.1 FKBP-type peptidyl-prolyl cis-trans isomerase [Fulvivirga marina]